MQTNQTFNLKQASHAIKVVAAHSGIKSGKFEPKNQNYTASELCEMGKDNAVVAVVSNKNKTIEITAWEVENYQLLEG